MSLIVCGYCGRTFYSSDKADEHDEVHAWKDEVGM